MCQVPRPEKEKDAVPKIWHHAAECLALSICGAHLRVMPFQIQPIGDVRHAAVVRGGGGKNVKQTESV